MPAKIIIERPACGECKFWDQMPDCDTGTCHAEPPRTSGVWPFTQHSDWCGRWAKLPPAPRAEA